MDLIILYQAHLFQKILAITSYQARRTRHRNKTGICGNSK